MDHQDAEEEDLGGGAGESEKGPQDAEDEKHGRDGDDGSRYAPHLNLHQVLVSDLQFLAKGLSLHPRAAAQTTLNSTSASLSAMVKPIFGT